MQPGDKLPDLTVVSTDNERLRLRTRVGQPLVLYFYPRDATAGCTREAQDFAALQPRFKAVGVGIVGVSRDTLSSHLRFRDKHALPFELISDPDEALCQAFDVIKEKTLYGRKHMGIERSTFLFDGKGRLRQAWRGVKVPGHAEAVLAAAEDLA